jgi:hypothetical protein
MTALLTGLLYVLAAFVLFVALATFVYQTRLLRHKGVSRVAFVEEFRSLAIPDVIPGAVYDYYKSSALWKKFSVSPQDRYEDYFSSAPEDITDDAKELVRRLGLAMPIESVLREWARPIETLGDMVQWLNWVRQHQQ